MTWSWITRRSVRCLVSSQNARMHARRRDASAPHTRIAIAGLIILLAGACGSPVMQPAGLLPYSV